MDSNKNELKKILNISSEKNHNMTIIFIVFLAYVIITTIGITDVNLLVSNTGVSLPLLSVIMPFKGFFIVTPMLVVALYAYIIVNFIEHAKKLNELKLHDKSFGSTKQWPFFMDFTFTKDSAWLFGIFHFFITCFLPLAALIVMLIQYGKSQDFLVSKLHLVILLGWFLLFIYYRVKISSLFYVSILKKLAYICLLGVIAICIFMYAYFIKIVALEYTDLNTGYEINSIEQLCLKSWMSSPVNIVKLIDIKKMSSFFLFPSLIIDSNDEVTLPSLKQWNDYVSTMNKKNDTDSNIIDNIDSSLYLPRLDLSGRSLNYISLHSAFIPNTDFSGANLQGAEFDGANLQNANFSDANLQGADFSRANLQGADFRGAKLQGANLSGANLQGTDFLGAKFQDMNFSGAKFKDVQFMGTNLQNADFSFANMQNMIFFESNLQGATFTGSNLQGADFSRANLQGADFAGAKLQGVNFKYAKLQGSSFCYPGEGLYIQNDANPQGDYFTGANLQGADFTNAELQGAELYNTNLQGAIFYKSNLLGADIANNDTVLIFNPQWNSTNWDDILSMSDNKKYKDKIQSAHGMANDIGEKNKNIFENYNIDTKLMRWELAMEELPCNDNSCESIVQIILNLRPQDFSEELSVKFYSALLNIYDYWNKTIPSVINNLEKEHASSNPAPTQTLREEIKARRPISWIKFSYIGKD